MVSINRTEYRLIYALILYMIILYFDNVTIGGDVGLLFDVRSLDNITLLTFVLVQLVYCRSESVKFAQL